MKAIQTIYADGISVEIHCDSMSESPRQWDNLTKMSLFAKRYKFPNELDLRVDDYLSWDEMENELKARHKYVFPVYMYEHGNVALSTTPFSCKWDSCRVGFAVVDDDEGMTDIAAVQIKPERRGAARLRHHQRRRLPREHRGQP